MLVYRIIYVGTIKDPEGNVLAEGTCSMDLSSPEEMAKHHYNLVCDGAEVLSTGPVEIILDPVS